MLDAHNNHHAELTVEFYLAQEQLLYYLHQKCLECLILMLFHWQLLYVNSVDHPTIQNLVCFQSVYLGDCCRFAHVRMKHRQHLNFITA